MTDTTDTTGSTETSTDQTGEPVTETEKSGNAEAARYRHQLRDAQAERDALGETVTRMQRAEVQRLTADQLEVPEDLFTVGGIELADLLDDDGNVDPGLVSTAIYGLLDQRPGLARSAPRQKGPILTGHDPGSAGGSGSWQDVLRGG